MTERTNKIEGAKEDEEQVSRLRRRILQSLGIGALLLVIPTINSITGNPQKKKCDDLEEGDEEECIDEEEEKAETEKSKESCYNGEVCETYYGIELRKITPKYTINNLPPLQKELMKKGGAKFDEHTGNVVYGNLANYIIDEPVVEFKHTLSQGRGNTKPHEGLLYLKISAAKALIDAERKLGEKIPVIIGLRSNELQQTFYQRNKCLGEYASSSCEKRPYPTAEPGLSEHEKAQAIDIDTTDRPKKKAVLIECGFLDDTANDPPHFTYKKDGQFSEQAQINSKKNDEYFTSPGYKKWYMRKFSKLDRFFGKQARGLRDRFKAFHF